MDSNILNQQTRQLKNKICQSILDYSTNNPETISFQKIAYQLINNNPNHIASVYGIENGVILYDTPVVLQNKVFDLTNLSIEVLIKIKEELEFHQNQKELKNQKAL